MERTKILLVEENKDFTFMTLNGLMDIIGGYKVKVATNGKEGLEIFKIHRPELIFGQCKHAHNERIANDETHS